MPDILYNLLLVEKTIKNVWKNIDYYRYRNTISPKKWPNWCFIPLDIITDKIFNPNFSPDYIDSIKNKSDSTEDARQNIIMMSRAYAMFASWRYTKGIYSFDNYLFDELIDQPHTDIIPVEVLKRSPEWCILIKFPKKIYIEDLQIELDSILYSIDAYLANEKEEMFLGLVPILNNNPICCMSVPLSLNKTISESLEIYNKGITYVESVPIETQIRIDTKVTAKFLPFILYLCSEEPEITGNEKPGGFKHKITNHRGYPKIYVPPHIRNFKVGEETGKKLKTFRELVETKKVIRPHIRRAHWHGYWVKSKETKELEFTYKWLAPSFVIGKNKLGEANQNVQYS